MRRSLAVPLAVLLLLGHAAAAAPSGGFSVTVTEKARTRLYFHLAGFQDFPINTQEPQDVYQWGPNLGLAAESLTCLPAGTPADGLRQGYHTYYGFSSPSYVEYNFTVEGKPRIWQDRGLGFDIRIDPQSPSVIHWFLTTHTEPPTSPDLNSAPLVVPNVVVRATMRTGEKIALGEEGYNSGTLLAQGQSAPATLAGQATTGANWTVVDGKNVYEIVTQLSFAGVAVIPKDQGYVLRIDVFERVAPGVCDNPDNGYLMPDVVESYTGHGHRPRLELTVLDPLRLSYLDAPGLFPAGAVQVVKVTNDTVVTMTTTHAGNKTIIRAGIASPWGAYDVDASSARLALAGTDREFVVPPAAIVQRYNEAGHLTQAVDFVWVLPGNLEAGTYSFSLEVGNLQHTATVAVTGSFDVAGEQRVPAPGLGLVVLAIALLAARRKGMRATFS